MTCKIIQISASARRFIEERRIEDITFDLIQPETLHRKKYVNEIEARYIAPADARGYRYFRVENYHIFISRKIKIFDELKLCTEGIWWMKRIYLNGAIAAVPFWFLDR